MAAKKLTREFIDKKLLDILDGIETYLYYKNRYDE